MDYIHSFKHLKGRFQIRKFDLEWHHFSAFWMNYFLFFLICIHIFPTGHSFQQCSLADHKLLITCILISTCCFTYKHIIYLLKWYFQQPPCLWASFILTDPQILIRHLDLPASFHERLRTNMAWLSLHNLGSSAREGLLLYHEGTSSCLLLPELLNSPPSLSAFIAQPWNSPSVTSAIHTHHMD